MTPLFTAAQDDLRRRVRALLTHPDSQAELREVAGGPGAEGPEGHPWRLWRQLGARGWLAPHWPVRYGGLGLSWVDAGIVTEELILHGVSDTPIINGVFNFGEAVRVAGTPRQKQRYLPRIASGHIMASALLSEPGSGSDLASLACAATPSADGWVLTGTKIWNAKAHIAEVALCAARTSGESGYAGISLFTVPLCGPGVTITALDTTSAETLYRIEFDGLRLDPDQLVGTAGEAWPPLVSILTLERAGLGYHARARRWLSALAERLRRADDDVAAELRPRVAALARRTAVGSELAWQAVRELDEGADVALASATAKWFNTELGADIVDLAQEHDLGLAGHDAASRALDYARGEALGLTLAAGTSEMMLSIIQGDLRGALAEPAADPDLPRSPLESAVRAGQSGQPSPDLGSVLIRALAPQRAARQHPVLVAAAAEELRSPEHPGPLEVTESDGGWSVSGRRWAYGAAGVEDHVDLLVPIRQAGRDIVALVDGTRKGVRITPARPTNRGERLAVLRVDLDDVTVTEADICGPGSYPAALAEARLAAAGYLLGSSWALLRAALDRAEDRRQFGRPISANQAVGHPLAAAYTRLRGAILFARRAAAAPDSTAAAQAFVMAAESSAEIVRLATRVHGASGLLREGPAQTVAEQVVYPAVALGSLAAVRAEVAAACAAAAFAYPAEPAVAQEAPENERTDFAVPEQFVPEHRLVEAQVQRTPEAIALVCAGETMTYAALNARANQVARLLVAQGVGPEIPVGVCLERGPDQIIAVLGVLKAGGAYVPLDPATPPSRLRDMIDDADPAVLVTQEWMTEWLPDDRLVLCLDTDAELLTQNDTDLPGQTHPDGLMYIMYTSGSSGRPKGVMVTHGGIGQRISWDRESFPLTADDAVLQFTSLGFDPAVWEIFAALTSGARLVLIPAGAHVDPRKVVDIMRDERVSALFGVPSQLELLIEQRPGLLDCPSLRYVFSGGDAMTPALVASFAIEDAPELYNMYGPTELSIDATAWRAEPVSHTVPIGHPLPYVSAYVGHPGWEKVADGEVGELWAGGAGLARGYVARAAETASAFRPGPVGSPPGSRVYRTGDLVLRRDDGILEFHGRNDRQVKVRGYRIEPAEVEAALLELPRISQAAVVAVDDRLVAFVVATEGTDPAGVRRRLAERVPKHLVPGRIVPVEALSRNPSGKIDYAALRERARGSAPPPTAAVCDSPDALRVLYAKVLGLAEVADDEEFFALGGDSLSAARLVIQATRDLGLPLTLEMLLGTPTVADLATALYQGK
ncbi:amino acid adenylation domain-containing protein [Catenulispora sp. NF23]|uniref:amino acid adenylation domain-containing protein n=1 Tax=Catenulispora pinistramenti TaxID=2705254 RepID=UPI001BAD41AD|nr:amino acid adenylation domain-containing protein [Catenulispora pinistramenti]MBS2533958.1 amino acid adenylation domain-containing protein [Catenulispora pinistramenti]